MSVDRQERIVVHQDGNRTREEHIVEDRNLEHRQTVSKVAQFLWLLFGALEVLIGFRVLLKLIAANPNSWFTSFVYQFSEIFVWPFQNIVSNPSFQNSVMEITSLIAMLVYALVGWGVVRLFWLVFYRRSTKSVKIYDKD